jgi:hypothetical protein
MLAAMLLLALAPGGGGGRVYLTVDEALALAFPGCVLERSTEVLSAAEAARVEALGGGELETRLVRPYVARKDGVLIGTAYFDAHKVRTKNEVLMLVVTPLERLARVEVLSFAEPSEYLPRASFYAQLQGQRLSERLEVGREIRGVAGATLSAEAATRAARRTLALHRVLAERRVLAEGRLPPPVVAR